eukprot:scaffold54553_cov30-Tisochrysis_lutea.AAC.6
MPRSGWPATLIRDGSATPGARHAPLASRLHELGACSCLMPPISSPAPPRELGPPPAAPLAAGGKEPGSRLCACECCSPRTVLISTSAPSTILTLLQNSLRSMSFARSCPSSSGRIRESVCLEISRESSSTVTKFIGSAAPVMRGARGGEA